MATLALLSVMIYAENAVCDKWGERRIAARMIRSLIVATALAELVLLPWCVARADIDMSRPYGRAAKMLEDRYKLSLHTACENFAKDKTMPFQMMNTCAKWRDDVAKAMEAEFKRKAGNAKAIADTEAAFEEIIVTAHHDVQKAAADNKNYPNEYWDKNILRPNRVAWTMADNVCPRLFAHMDRLIAQYGKK